MQKKVMVSLFFVCGLLLSSCASWQMVKVAPGLNVNNEIIMKPELQNLISGKKQNLKIVLRVPDAPKNITQETQKEVSRPYDRLERELSKAGFIVRDRELLERVISEVKMTGYLDLARAIDTDLILEILYFGPCDLSHKKYYDLKTGCMLELSNPSLELKQPGVLTFPMHGGQIDCRVITVRDGTVSGMFTIYNLPCDGVCDFEILPGKALRNPEPNPEEIKGWGVGTEEQNIRQLAGLLAQTLNEGEIVVSKIQPGSLAEKNGFRVNDIIEKINNQTVYNLSQVMDMIVKSDGKIDILFKRDGHEIPVSFIKKFAESIGAQIIYKLKGDIKSSDVSMPIEEKLPAAPTLVTVQKEEIIPVAPTPVIVQKEEIIPAASSAVAISKDEKTSVAAPAKAAQKDKKSKGK